MLLACGKARPPSILFSVITGPATWTALTPAHAEETDSTYHVLHL